jgi:hypothetical protein
MCASLDPGRYKGFYSYSVFTSYCPDLSTFVHSVKLKAQWEVHVRLSSRTYVSFPKSFFGISFRINPWQHSDSEVQGLH